MNTETKPPRPLHGTLLWTMATAILHTVSLAFLLGLLIIAGPGYGRPFEETDLAMPPFLYDVIGLARFVVSHAGAVCGAAAGFLVLDALFYFVVRQRGDRVLARVWSGLVTVFLLTLIAIVGTSMLLAKAAVNDSGIIGL